MSGSVKANEQTVQAIREGGPVDDPKDKVLVQLVQAIVKDRGYVADELVQTFLDAGHTKENLFDLLVCNMLKSLSNYANHITKTELNPELESFAR